MSDKGQIMDTKIDLPLPKPVESDENTTNQRED